MAQRALRFTLRSGSADPERCRIDATTIASFTASIAGDRPTAFVMGNDDISALARRETVSPLLVDRGVKHPAKGLARLLLGSRGGIPLIRGSYRAAGQLMRSIRTLLRHAGDGDDGEVFLVGAEAEVFEALWRRTAPVSKASLDASVEVHRTSRGAGEDDESLELLRLLVPREVPPELKRRFVGQSPSMQLVRQLILRAADTIEPVLILGDTGTGKEVVARGIHEFGPRRTERFTPVNCGAIPGELFESELFGHVRGAFTSAVARKEGLWRVAGRGTLFLDEIGDLRLHHQAKILRALQEGRVRPVGGKDEVAVEARIVAATNRDLYAMVRAGEFREDLYFRLRSFLIRTPPLREHPEDIAALAIFFWNDLTDSAAKRLPATVLDELSRYSWPGNARELRTVLAQLNSLFPGQEPRLEYLNAVLRMQGHVLRSPTAPRITRRLERLRSRDQLLQLEDVLRACRVALRPLRHRLAWLEENGSRLQDAMRRRLAELRAVLQHDPGDEAAGGGKLPARLRDDARALRGELVELAATLEIDPRGAQRRWRKDLRQRLDALLEAVEAAVRGADRG